MAQLFAQFDGDEVDGKIYRLGDPIDDSLDVGTRDYLTGIGRIGASRPAITVVITTETKPVADMTRLELEQGAIAAFSTQLASMPDDDLRDGIERHRARFEQEQSEGKPPSDDDRPTYDDLKDKPTGSLKTAELEVVADAEQVDLTDAKTNADRVKLIDDARKAKAAS